MHQKKISIITPSFNSGKLIEEAIHSVLKQDYSNFEHIIVDGGSTDDTTEILKKYSHLKWISEPDKGQSHAMNKGFIMSDGDIIVYLNADDFFEENAFNTVIPYFEQGHKFVVGQIKVINEKGLLFINDPKITFKEMLRWWETNAYPYNPVGYFYLREIQEKIKFNENNHFTMDLEFLLDASCKYSFIKIAKIFGTFRLFKETKTGKKGNDKKAQKESMSFCKKYYSLLNEIDKKQYIKDLNLYIHSNCNNKIKHFYYSFINRDKDKKYD